MWSPPDFVGDEERRRQIEEALAAKFAPEPTMEPAAPQPAPRPFDPMIRSALDTARGGLEFDSDPEYLAAKRSDFIGDVTSAAGRGGRIAMQALTGHTFAPDDRRSAVKDYLARKHQQVGDAETLARTAAYAQFGGQGQQKEPASQAMIDAIKELGWVAPPGLTAERAVIVYGQARGEMERKAARGDAAALAALDRADRRAGREFDQAMKGKEFSLRERELADKAAERGEAREARAEARSDKDREQASRASLGRDWEADPASPLSTDPTLKTAFLKSAASGRKLTASTAKIREIIQRHGTNPATIPEDALTKLQALVADVRTQIKNIDQLGVVAGPDMPMFIEPQIDNPASFKNWLSDKFGRFNPMAQLDQLDDMMVGNIMEEADSYGASPTKTGAFNGYAQKRAAKARAKALKAANPSMTPEQLKAALREEGF